MIRLGVLVSLLAAACSPAAPTAEIPLWVIGTTPIVTIGANEADPGHELSRVSGALKVSGGFLVANSGSCELRLFDSTGHFINSYGRKGQGPGDFGAVITPFPAPGDSILVFDVENMRWTVHDATGRYTRVVAGGADAFPKPAWLYRGMIIERPSPGPIPQWALTALNGLPETPHGTPIRRARLDDAGFLWIGDAGDIRAWTVLADSGVTVGRVVLPKGFELLEAGDDFLVGLERDTVDREIVRVYRLERPRAIQPPAREPMAVLSSDESSAAESMIADFRNLLTAQEIFYSQHATYTSRADSLEFMPESGAEVTILHGDVRHWAGVLYDRKTRTTCGISVGFPAPAGWIDGLPFCAR